MRPTREEAWKLLNEYNKSDALLKHGLAVEGVMRHFAEINGEDPEKCGVIGLLHDLDYEMYPEKHCVKTAEIMRENDIDEDYIHAVCSHGWGLCCDVEPVEKMEKAGNLIGVAFQIQDDILDVTSTQEVLGKPVLSDEKNHKTTYVTLYGMEKAEKDVIEMSNEALRLIEETGENEFLDELVRRLIHREK